LDSQVKVAIWVTGQFLPGTMNVDLHEYYKNKETKLKCQIDFQKRFPEAILYPGIYPDFGTTVEPSAYGSEILWFKNQVPYSKPCIHSIKEADKIKIPDPLTDGLMPAMLNEYKYMWNTIDKRLIDKYGHLDGVAFSVGPLETAGLILGYDQLFIEMYLHPKIIEDLLEKITIGLINWIHEQEKINGKIKRLFLVDHQPSQLSKDFFQRFGLPYFKEIFNEFSGALKLWHNEDRVLHIIEHINEIGCDIFHCGDDIEQLQKHTDNVIMMGNLPPIELLLNGSEDEIIERTKELLNKVPDKERLLVSTAGGMSPGTSLKNIDAIFKGVKEFYKD
jgi:uroporphyrinogen decarboxylase